MSRNQDDAANEWLPDETGIGFGGHVGGDVQVGESFSVRYSRADRPRARIARTAYAVNLGSESKGQFLVRVQTEWLVCSDPADPGGTELWSDNAYDDEAESYETEAEAEVAARRVAADLLRDGPSLTWDGCAPWGN